MDLKSVICFSLDFTVGVSCVDLRHCSLVFVCSFAHQNPLLFGVALQQFGRW
jgi:hypothetical protein